MIPTFTSRNSSKHINAALILIQRYSKMSHSDFNGTNMFALGTE